MTIALCEIKYNKVRVLYRFFYRFWEVCLGTRIGDIEKMQNLCQYMGMKNAVRGQD